MMLPFRISVQLSVLIAHAVWNYKQAGAVSELPAYLYLITGISRLILFIGRFTLIVKCSIKRGQSFEKHFFCFHKLFMSKVMMNSN